MTTEQPQSIAPPVRVVDQFTGYTADQLHDEILLAAGEMGLLQGEIQCLSDENASLRCRVDELAEEASAAHLVVDWLNALLGELTTERDILASQRTELVGQRDVALAELATARAALTAARS